MARPKPDGPDPAAVRALADAANRLAVRVTPGARSEAITIAGDRILVKVRAKAQDGAANDAVLRMLARTLRCPRSRLALLRGATSRDKLIRIG